MVLCTTLNIWWTKAGGMGRRTQGSLKTGLVYILAQPLTITWPWSFKLLFSLPEIEAWQLLCRGVVPSAFPFPWLQELTPVHIWHLPPPICSYREHVQHLGRAGLWLDDCEGHGGQQILRLPQCSAVRGALPVEGRGKEDVAWLWMGQRLSSSLSSSLLFSARTQDDSQYAEWCSSWLI